MFTDISPITFIIAAGVGGLFLLLFRGRNKEPRKFVIPQFMFTMREFNRLEAEGVMGAMVTERHGGQREDPGAVAIYRSGRLWGKAPVGRDAGSMRKREALYVTRHGDPAPLKLLGLFEKNASIFGAVTKAEWRPVKNLAVKSQMSDTVRKHSTNDAMVRRLTFLAVALGLMGGAAWLALTIISSLKA